MGAEQIPEGYLSAEKTVLLAQKINSLLGADYGFVCLVLNLDTNTMSVVSDAPDVEVIELTLRHALHNLDETNSFRLGPNEPGSLN